MKNLGLLFITISIFSCGNVDDIPGGNTDDFFEERTIEQTIDINGEFKIFAINTEKLVNYSQTCIARHIVSSLGNSLLEDKGKCSAINLSFTSNTYTIKNPQCGSLSLVESETNTFSIDENSITFDGGFEFFQRLMPDVKEITSSIRFLGSYKFMLVFEFDYSVNNGYKIHTGDTNTATVVFVNWNHPDYPFSVDYEKVYTTLGMHMLECETPGVPVDSDDIPWWNDDIVGNKSEK